AVHRARIPRPGFDFLLVEDEKLFPADTPLETLEAFLEAKFDLVAACFADESDRASFLLTKRSAIDGAHSPAAHDKRDQCAHAEHEAECFSWRLVGGGRHRMVEDELERRFGHRRIGPSAQARIARMLSASQRGDWRDRMIVERFLHGHPHQTLFTRDEVKRVRALLKQPTEQEIEQAAAAEKASRRPRPELPADLGGLCLGAVFKRDSRGDDLEERVIAFDARNVFYETRHPGQTDWSARPRRGRIGYYGSDTAWFLHEARLVRVEEPSAVDLARHRPDLPLRFGESDRVEWEKRSFDSHEHFAAWLDEKDSSLLRQPALEAACIALLPYSGLSIGKPVFVEADLGTSVGMLELLWRGCQARQTMRGKRQSGIGFYRLGLEKGDVPSYLVGGLRDSDAG
ncbi:MAG: hypothetical protein ACREIA_09560, partial [Opitutaceae bacterium]